MNDSVEDILDKTFSSVKPYLNSPSELEGEMEKISEECSSLSEVREKLDELSSKEEDPSRRTDYRIFINKLREE